MHPKRFWLVPSPESRPLRTPGPHKGLVLSGTGAHGSDRQAEKFSLIPRAEIRANKPEFPGACSQTCVAELPPALRPSHKRSVSYPPGAHAPLNCRWPPGHRRGIPLLENQDKPYPIGALGPVAAEPVPWGGRGHEC